MASTVKRTLASTFANENTLSAPDSDHESGYSSTSSIDEEYLAHKYVLRVTAGPSYDPATHRPVSVNGPDALTFDNEFMTTKIKVRIKNYEGLPKGSPAQSAYFKDPQHSKDRYSIGFSFVPKAPISARDVVWGNDFDNPIRDRLPPGFNTAFRIVKDFIDPGLSCDAYADKPWLYGHALSCWLAFRVGEKMADEEREQLPADDEEAVLKEGADGSGAEVRDKYGIPGDAARRRKHFLKEENREAFEFEEGRLYQGDFFNPYLDFQKFSLRLPGFSLGVIRYINDKTHKLRYVFKNRETNDVYFVVVFTLLFGQELRDALEAEGTPEAHENGVNGSP